MKKNGLRRLMALLICAVMLLGPTATQRAFAIEIETGALKNHAYTSDDNVCRERISSPRVSTVSMKMGEYCTVSPLHWINTNYLSYDVIDVSVSGEAVEAESTLVNGRQNMGVKLHAVRVGKATVTITYQTYLSSLGVNYIDNRSTSLFSQTINVTVTGGSLSMKMWVSSDQYEQVSSVGIYTGHRIQQIDEAFVAASDMTYLLGTLLGQTNLPAPANQVSDISSVGSASGTAVSIGGRFMQAISNFGKGIWGAISKIGGVASNLSSGLGTLVGGSAIARRDTFWYNANIPIFEPETLKLKIELTNNSSSTASVSRVWAACDSHLSFKSSNGPWKGTQDVATGLTLAPDESITLEVPLYARVAYGEQDKDQPKRLAYIANISGKCNYLLEDEDESQQIGTATNLKAYSYMTRDDIIKMNKDMKIFPDFYQTLYGTSDIEQLFYIACPVNVEILAQDGTPLAVIASDDEQIYQGNGVLAGACGDEKYVILMKNRDVDCRIRICAVEDGSMNVLTFAGLDSEPDINAYLETPLRAGDAFELSLQGETPAASLNRIGADGQLAEEERTARINRDTIEASLEETNLSREAIPSVADAMLHGLLANPVETDFQRDETLEEFCQALLQIYGMDYGNDSISGTEGAPFTTAAVQMGILPKDYLEPGIQQAAEAGVTLGEAAEMICNFMSITGLFAESVFDLSMSAETYTQEDDEESARTAEERAEDQAYALAQLKRYDIFSDEGLRENAISLEESLCALNQLYKLIGHIQERNLLVATLTFDVLDDMEQVYRLKDSPYGYAIDRDFIVKGVRDQDAGDDILTTLSVTSPSAALSEFNQSVVNEFLFFAYWSSSLSDAEFAYDPLNYNQAKALSESGTIGELKLFQCAKGYGSVNLGDNIYGFAPAYFDDGNGGIYGDKLYLAYMENRQTVDETDLDTYDIDRLGQMEVELLILDDPNAVKEYLSFIRKDIESYSRVETVTPEDFEELRQGSNGEDVRRLQETLIAAGWLDDVADGVYGKKTAAAVSYLQERLGLEPTGIADPLTQAAFYGGYGSDGGKEKLLRWMDVHCPE